jgi:phage tail sheath protein FI
MSQADIDNGRLIAEIVLAPAVPVEQIRVRLPLDGASAGGAPA